MITVNKLKEGRCWVCKTESNTYDIRLNSNIVRLCDNCINEIILKYKIISLAYEKKELESKKGEYHA